MSMLRISNSIFSRITACLLLPVLYTQASEEIARLVDEYLLNEGKPSERNAEIWADLATRDNYDLKEELDRVLDQDVEFLPKVHIAKIAAGLLPQEQARTVVFRALETAEDERPDLRHLFAESVVKVALPQDIELLKSFRDPNRRGVTKIVDFAIAEIEDGSASTDRESAVSIAENSDPVPSENATKALREPEEAGERSSLWPYVLMAVAILGIVVLLVRAKKRSTRR